MAGNGALAGFGAAHANACADPRQTGDNVSGARTACTVAACDAGVVPVAAAVALAGASLWRPRS